MFQSDSFSEIRRKNVLCVAGCCRRDFATKTRRVMCVMTLIQITSDESPIRSIATDTVYLANQSLQDIYHHVCFLMV